MLSYTYFMLVDGRLGRENGKKGIQVTVLDRAVKKSKSLTIRGSDLETVFNEVYFFYRAKYGDEIKKLWEDKYGKKTIRKESDRVTN